MPISTDITAFSPLGFGCARIGSFNNAMSSRETHRLLELALQLGITLFDTADIYGQGDSERAVGRLLRHRRGAAFVVTKVGKTFSRSMHWLAPLKPLVKAVVARSDAARRAVVTKRTAHVTSDFSPAYIGSAIDASLQRLEFDCIDGLLLHSPDADQIRTDGLSEVLHEARALGKIRHFGVACDDSDAVRAALDLPGVELIELPLPVLVEAAEALDRAHEKGVHILVREVIRYRGAFAPYDAVAAALQHRSVAAVVAGTTSRSHLWQLADAAGLPARNALQRRVD